MQFIEPGGVEVLRTLHSRPIMNASTTKVRRKLFADSSPLNENKIKNDTARILGAEYERIKAKYNYDFDANKPLRGRWDWQNVESEEAPTFYSKAYPEKNAGTLRSYLMACVKDQNQNIRNNFYHSGHFMSLANLATPCTGDELKTTTTKTTSTSTLILPETPCKVTTTLSHRSSHGTKRKLTQTDDVSDYSEVKGDDNHIFPNSSSSHSPSETLSSTTELSSPSQESVGQNLQNVPCTTTTDNNQSSSQTTQTTLLAQQEKQTRQTNITEFMKSQKIPTEPVAKHARRA